MKNILTIFAVAGLTLLIQAVRPQTPPSALLENSAAKAPIVEQLADEPKQDPEALQTASNAPSEPVPAVEPPAPAPVAAPQPETCRSAIAKVWPAHLQAGAITVMTHENRREDPSAKGAVNADAFGSQDFGCFQINDYWHPAYFTDGDWQDPMWAAQYALRIYEGRKARDGIGWTAWYAVQGILW